MYDIEDEENIEAEDDIFSVDRSKFKDEKGRYITQGLFLEVNYNADQAVYTFDGEHKEYKGKVYPSLKKLYLDMADVTEYNFAYQYLFDWEHWLRLTHNNLISSHIEKWRAELSLKLRAAGLQTIIDAALSDNSYQAGKYLAEKGWTEKTRGRPSKEEIKTNLDEEVALAIDFSDDFEMLKLVKGDKNG